MGVLFGFILFVCYLSKNRKQILIFDRDGERFFLKVFKIYKENITLFSLF